MPKKVREILQILYDDGWFLQNQKGSHMQLKHPDKPGRVTVPNHGMGQDVDVRTEKSILKQAGLWRKES
ncbi:type II toxin-antitoxin system HicA family toxin [Leptospira sp. WS60.C2]